MQFCAPAASDAELLATLQSIGADRFMGRDETGLDRGSGERGGQLSRGPLGLLTISRAPASPSGLPLLGGPTGAMAQPHDRLCTEKRRRGQEGGQTVTHACGAKL